MPKRVDHDERRREIAAAVARLAAERGLNDVSFREVAAEAGMSVALVQHYFGTKHNMLVGTLDLVSAAMGRRIEKGLARLDADATPFDRVREVATSFIPVDAETRQAMLVYHGFAGAALTDPALRSDGAFSGGRATIGFFAEQLAAAKGPNGAGGSIDPGRDALALLSLVLGLSLSVLLGQVTEKAALDILNHHLRRLEDPLSVG